MVRRLARRPVTVASLLVVVFVAFGLPADAGASGSTPQAESPVVEAVEPAHVELAQLVTVRGRHFGADRGTVLFGDIEASAVHSWSDTEIAVQVPSQVQAGDVAVRVRPSSALRPSTSSGTVTVPNYVLPRGEIVPGVVQVRLRLGATPAELATRWDVDMPSLVVPDAAVDSLLRRFYNIEVPVGEEADYIVRLAADPDIEWAEPVRYAQATEARPNDTRLNDQWAVPRIEAVKGWAYAKGGGVTIGVVDSGVDAAHADLAGKVVQQRYFQGADTVDRCGHGTHVAGIAAATTNNSRGVAGHGWYATIASYKVLDWQEFSPGRFDCVGSGDAITNGVVAAVSDGVDVLNLSLGDRDNTPDPCPQVLQTVLQDAANAGMFVAVATGNTDTEVQTWPSNCPGVFNVTNIQPDNTKRPNARYGTWVHLGAPGTDILSTSVPGAPLAHCGGGTYIYCTGTSMATPMVAGVAALLLSAGATRDQVWAYLRTYATPLTAGVCGQGLCGAGLLNAGWALQQQELAHLEGYIPQGCCLTGDPDVASWASGRLDVYARGTDNKLWHRWHEAGWSGWEPWGGPPAPVGGEQQLTSGPGAVSWGFGRVDVFARGADNKLWQRFWQNGFSSWTDLGAPDVFGLASGPDVSTRGLGRIDVFVKGSNGRIWHKFHDAGWSAWLDNIGAPPAGVGSDPSAVSWSSGRIDLFVRGQSDGQLWHAWWDGSWSQWESLGGALVGAPDVASAQAGRLDVFIRGTDDQLYRKWWDGTTWSHWDALGPRLASGPGAVSWGPGRFDVFITGTDQYIHQKWRNP